LLLLTPTVPTPAIALLRNTPRRCRAGLAEELGWSFFTYLFNLTGQPAASIRCGFTADGLPFGLELVGRRHADAVVLAASAAFEAAGPWQFIRPALA
jgi:aspartyl-tRNA(Asn)/glutamyl-tRNA(Gln) amidotransferase subunit A